MIIAMGMMVDNAIVVVDGIVVRFGTGMGRTQAVVCAAGEPAWASCATVVASMAFFPIFLSPTSSGEFAGSLFTVVAISLLLSWLLSQTVTPLLCLAWLPGPKPGTLQVDPYQGRFFGAFRRLLATAIRCRVGFLGGLLALLAALDFQFSLRAENVFFRLQPVAVDDRLWHPRERDFNRSPAI